MTKEEILANHEYEVHYYGHGRAHILEAMDEWAKQKAIAFAEWKETEGWCMLLGAKVWEKPDQSPYGQQLSTDQLYELYQESLNNQP